MSGLQFNPVDFVLTFADLLALVCCLGALACRLWIVPAGIPCREAPHIRHALARLAAAALAVLAVTTLALLWWRTAVLTGEPPQSLAALPVVLSQTHVGQVWLLRIAALVVAGALLWVAIHRDTEQGWLWWLLLLMLAVVAFSRSATGHAADAGDFTVKEWADWTHLLAVSVWAGSVMAALLVVFPWLTRVGIPDADYVAQFSGRFSRSSGIALGVVLLAGSYNAGSRLGSLMALLDTVYGWTLMAKLCLVGMAMLLGAVNRFVHVRRIVAWEEERVPATMSTVISERLLRLARFHLTVRVEGGVLFAVLLVTALLLQQMPPAMHR